MKQKIIIAGGSGFLGQALTQSLLARGYQVVVLGRGAARRDGDLQHLAWDGGTPGNWVSALEGAAAIVNFAGKNINCRHTPENKREIIRSRVDSVHVLGQAIAGCARPPQAFLQASGIGYYGDSGAQLLDETAPLGRDFMAEVCREWEGAFDALELPDTRKIVFRIGMVLGRDGGALPLLERLTRLFLGGAVGRGQQFVSWIHGEDLNRMFLAAIEQPSLSGAFNANAPRPVTNREFMRALRRALHRPWSPPAPASLARLGAWLMGSTGDLALLSYRCTPARFLEHGFTFEFPNLNQALSNLYGMEH